MSIDRRNRERFCETVDGELLSLHERNFAHHRIQAVRDNMAGGPEQVNGTSTSVEGPVDHITGGGTWFR